MKEIRIYNNSKTAKIVKSIIKTEELNLDVKYMVDAIGDSQIVIKGSVEEIKIFEEIYNVVAL